MDILVTMSAPPALVAGHPSIGHKTRELALSNDSEARQQQPISIRSPSTSTSTINDGGNATRAPVSPHMENATTTSIGGATVFIGAGIPDVVLRSSTSARIPEVQLENGSREAEASAVSLLKQQNFIPQKPAHIVKIQIKPGCDKSTNTRVISAVSIHSEDVYTTCSEKINGIDSVDNSVVVFANNSIINSKNLRYTSSNKKSDIVNSNKNSNEPCVTINGKNNVCNYLNRDLPTEQSLSCSCKTNENTNNVDMVQQRNLPEALNASHTSNSSFYYSAPLSTTMISSGQCSPSETLDSGTCSDLDGTPPPLPKTKSSGPIIMGSRCKSSVDVHHLMNQRHDTTGSLTSSGAEVESDDNESIISCDSLNSGDLPINGKIKFCIPRGSEHKTDEQHCVYKDNQVESKSDFVQIDDITNNSMGRNKRIEDLLMTNIGEKHLNSDTKKSPSASPITSGISNLSTTLSTPRMSPEIPETRPSSTSSSTLTSTSVPIVSECTYEERKHKQECISNTAALLADALVNSYCTINHVYEDDRFYKFHINERDEASNDTISRKQEKGVENDDECFAGYKIFEREAIRSAKGTVRGVKNRVRAGIATFLQRPSSKVSTLFSLTLQVNLVSVRQAIAYYAVTNFNNN